MHIQIQVVLLDIDQYTLLILGVVVNYTALAIDPLMGYCCCSVDLTGNTSNWLHTQLVGAIDL